MIELFANGAQTTLSGAITGAATSLVVASATGFPAPSSGASPPSQFRIRVEDAPAGSGVNLEYMRVTDVAGATWQVARGQEGTAAVPHADGSAVTLVATAGALATIAVPQVPLTIPQLVVFGHSLAAGGQARVPVDGSYPSKLADLLCTQDFRWMPVGGALACWNTSGGTGDGGWSWVMQKASRAGSNGEVGSSKAAPYNPKTHAALIHYGLNDLAALGSSNLRPFQEALRAILHRACAAAVWEDADTDALGGLGGWTFTGTWTMQATTIQNSGAGFRYTTTVNDNARFTTPNDTPAGRMVSIQLSVNEGDSYVVTPKIDGVAQADITVDGSLICDPAQVGKANALLVRFPNVAGGAHTYDLTLKTLTAGSMKVDCANLLADPLDGPYLILPTPNRPLNYTLWNTWTHGPSSGQPDAMSDASIPILTAAQDAIFQEMGFPGVQPDIDTALNKQAKWFYSDGAHWTDEGHALVAETIYAAVRANPPSPRVLLRPSQMARAGKWKAIGEQGSPAFQSGWVNNNFVSQFMRTQDGLVHVTFQVKSGSPLTGVIFTLPPGYRPIQTTLRQGYQQGGTLTTFQINPTGEVFAIVGGNATSMGATFQFQAEQ